MTNMRSYDTENRPLSAEEIRTKPADIANIAMFVNAGIEGRYSDDWDYAREHRLAVAVAPTTEESGRGVPEIVLNVLWLHEYLVGLAAKEGYPPDQVPGLDDVLSYFAWMNITPTATIRPANRPYGSHKRPRPNNGAWFRILPEAFWRIRHNAHVPVLRRGSGRPPSTVTVDPLRGGASVPYRPRPAARQANHLVGDAFDRAIHEFLMLNNEPTPLEGVARAATRPLAIRKAGRPSRANPWGDYVWNEVMVHWSSLVSFTHDAADRLGVYALSEHTAKTAFATATQRRPVTYALPVQVRAIDRAATRARGAWLKVNITTLGIGEIPMLNFERGSDEFAHFLDWSKQWRVEHRSFTTEDFMMRMEDYYETRRDA